MQDRFSTKLFSQKAGYANCVFHTHQFQGILKFYLRKNSFHQRAIV